MNKKLAHSGFTLVELLLYVAIAAVMLLAISVFLASLLQSRVKNQTVAEVEQQGSAVMQIISQTARNADTINSPAPATSAAALSLNTYTPVNNPTLFDLSNGVIRITEGAGAAVPLTNSHIVASSLTVQNLSRASTPGTVRIQFTLTHANPEGRNEYEFSKTFSGSASLRQP